MSKNIPKTEAEIEEALRKRQARREKKRSQTPIRAIELGHNGDQYTLGILLREGPEKVHHIDSSPDISRLLSTTGSVYQGVGYLYEVPVRLQPGPKSCPEVQQSLIEGGARLESMLYRPPKWTEE